MNKPQTDEVPDNTEHPRILICDPIHPLGIERLRRHAQVDVINGPKLGEDELAARISNYHAVINRSRTAIPASVIRQGQHLRIIGRAGVGLDNIDVVTAREMGIEVVNAPNANTVAVAEHAFALMLALARQIPRADSTMKAGKWAKSSLTGVSLAGKTLGIIGFGRIGRAVARRAKAFDMHIIVNQTRWTPELAQDWRIENVDLFDLLARSDFVTIHVPMRPANMGLIRAEHLAHMKPTAYLINTARGEVVDEGALLHALNTGQIAGAGLDVFAGEPTFCSELASHPRVLATPHIGASTEEAQAQAALDVVDQVLTVLQRRSVAETLGLRVVPTASVFPHEEFHAPRVERLAARLIEDGRLANPPLVAELRSRREYVVLDGATRVTVLQQLGYPHIVVQVIDPTRDNVQLFAWNHAVCGESTSSLVALARAVPGLSLVETEAAAVRAAMHERGGLGYLVTRERRAFLLEADAAKPGSQHSDDWLTILKALVDGYGRWGDVERTLHTDIDQLSSMYRSFAGVFVFPALSTDVVLQMAAQGRRLPAGITRFVIPGRILRLNAPLDMLRSDEPLSLKHDWLDRFVQEKLGGRQVRYYEEPVVLLDE